MRLGREVAQLVEHSTEGGTQVGDPPVVDNPVGAEADSPVGAEEEEHPEAEAEVGVVVPMEELEGRRSLAFLCSRRTTTRTPILHPGGSPGPPPLHRIKGYPCDSPRVCGKPKYRVGATTSQMSRHPKSTYECWSGMGRDTRGGTKRR